MVLVLEQLLLTHSPLSHQSPAGSSAVTERLAAGHLRFALLAGCQGSDYTPHRYAREGQGEREEEKEEGKGRGLVSRGQML